MRLAYSLGSLLSVNQTPEQLPASPTNLFALVTKRGNRVWDLYCFVTPWEPRTTPSSEWRVTTAAGHEKLRRGSAPFWGSSTRRGSSNENIAIDDATGDGRHGHW